MLHELMHVDRLSEDARVVKLLSNLSRDPIGLV
jgi:hypothetical protein